MTAIRTASAAALGLTALLLSAPAAVAGDNDSFQVSVAPTTIAAGGQVTLYASGCSDITTVSAGIFDTVTIDSGSGQKTATVDWDAKQAALYTVKFECKGGPSRSVDLTIASGRQDNPQPPPVPHGVKAGVGGSLAGFDLHEIGLGAALIVGAMGGAYYFSRRRTGEGDA
ncbi:MULTISPECIES: hypothetical protein [unclassified Streptomyces]|uniref:hypothetical protein n=1 Tax=unclassified Streptomyces TaxID=2593676 RepID=UPI000DBA5AC9|nr:MULTISPECIES: hypothetical protein [unclassified Streptomyces]MYT74800.1 hypothetical protein [Streptomyces sp. SID8367]RAJ91787.1 hypothetical protein K377_00556 [Streptomyces sp. PsTaAH-137]